MTANDKILNVLFAQRKAELNARRAKRLAAAKVAAHESDKEPFTEARFREIYARLNPEHICQYTPWEMIIAESEYNYYVTFSQKMTMVEFAIHMRYLGGCKQFEVKPRTGRAI